MKYPLANDVNGNPIDVPQTAAAWRVRRANGRPGRPQNVYDPETGRLLEVPLDSTVDDMRDSGCGPGRYRLEAVDGESKTLPGVVAFTELVVEAEERDPVAEIAEPLNRLLNTVEHQSDTICRALEAMAQAFGPVRPPRFVEHDEPETQPREEAMRPDQIVQNVASIAKTVADAWKGGGAS